MNRGTSPLVVLLCGAFACSGQVQESGHTQSDASSSDASLSSQSGSDAGGNNDPNDDGGPANLDPLVGSWTYSGSVPDLITVTLTFGVDHTLTMQESVAPLTTPAGGTNTSCITMDTYLGTYAEGVDGGTNTLALTFTGGTANAIVDCDAGRSGTPMTPDSIADYREQGLVPATMNNYAVTSTALVLTPTSTLPAVAGESCGPGPCDHGLATRVTTFTKPD
jgi:hypothetical protein